MYTGHIGVALCGKGVRPGVPLWGLVLAAFSVDVVVKGLEALGVPGEVTVWLSSAASILAVAALVGLGSYLLTRDRRLAALLGIIVGTHAVADALTSRIVLWPGGPEAGLLLYRRLWWDFGLEAGLVLIGWLVYQRSLPPARRASWPTWVMLAAAVACQAFFLYSN